jgi:EAL domain-containing protein (putative c-di-GMP-specific phosphodiesterase class I)
LKLETDLQSAVELEQLRLVYQPVICLRTGALRGFEALVRWEHQGRMISPADFIPVAEETGEILRIGRWVIIRALAQLADWRRRYPGLGRFGMALNLSRRQLVDTELLRYIRAAASSQGLSLSDLELELTESAAMENLDVAQRTINQLHEAGIRICLDDFGVGYSSLSCLHQFPLSVLKIDRSFVENLTRRPDGGAVLQAVVTMAHSLRLSVVAEGIETPEQAEHTRSLCCDYAQGYYFAGGLTANEAEDYLAQRVLRRAA